MLFHELLKQWTLTNGQLLNTYFSITKDTQRQDRVLLEKC